MYKLVALLPMKANSERVIGKNFKIFKTKPLYRWVLDKLLALDEIDKVIINTDASEILKLNGLPQSDKIIIRERKLELCGDFVSMNKIIQDDINAVDAEKYLMTHTTNPLISQETFSHAISTYEELDINEFDSLFSVNKYQSRFYNGGVQPLNHDPSNLIRTQDLPPLFEENSCLYMFTRKSFEKTNARVGFKPKLYPTTFFESVDIDDATNWSIAELYYDYLNKFK
ncbi:MAG: CMP-N-acetylneuraminic acid synthetase [Salibacteraceae bacterium]|jgi:CMP-N-acetylneuraminic acid synthetase